MSVWIGLPEKAILKLNRDLLELHKKVVTNYLHQRGIKLKSRKRLFQLYDYFIDENNIQCYFFYPVKPFVIHLVRGTLSEIDKYFIANGHQCIKSSKQKKRKP